ncbi:TPA: T9SS type A sorting domain-containing protein [Candidatus Micrarchaeota archaeon]|nr:T9SS type A sorting domain-containing protein [Candidatus Micrarchaeota archaeon]
MFGGSKSKAQATIEYVTILILLLVALAPLLYLGYRDLVTKNSAAQAIAVVKQIASTVDQVRAQGQGSRIIMRVQMPENIESAFLNRSEVFIRIYSIDGQLSDISANTNANLTGSLPVVPGVYFINVTMLDNGTVSVAPSS